MNEKEGYDADAAGVAKGRDVRNLKSTGRFDRFADAASERRARYVQNSEFEQFLDSKTSSDVAKRQARVLFYGVRMDEPTSAVRPEPLKRHGISRRLVSEEDSDESLSLLEEWRKRHSVQQPKKENVMNRSERELNVSGILNATAGESWLSVADSLARVSREDFDKLIAAFRAYRDAHGKEKGLPVAV